MSLFLALLAVGWAQAPGCERLTKAEFVDRVHASLDAIERADIDGHKSIIDDLEERLPCMAFVPDTRTWADFLVGVAIVKKSQGEDWEPWLATAFYTEPRVELPVGPSHAFWSHQLPAKPEPTDEVVPEGVQVFVDGLLVSKIPQPVGLHLVQRRDGDGWQTKLILDEPIPKDWMKTPELPEREGSRVGGFAEAVVGVGQRGQRPESPGTFVGENTATGVAVGAAVDGYLRIYGGLGLRFEVAAPMQLPDAGVDGTVGAGWSMGPLTASVGAGVRSMTLTTGTGDDLFWLPYGGLGVAYRKSGMFAALDVGASPAVLRTYLRAGYRPIERLSVSAEVRWAQAAFEQQAANRAIPAQAWTAGVRAGIAWGKR